MPRKRLASSFFQPKEHVAPRPLRRADDHVRPLERPESPFQVASPRARGKSVPTREYPSGFFLSALPGAASSMRSHRGSLTPLHPISLPPRR